MDTFWHDVGLELPALATLVRVGLRLLAAVVLGGVVGWERERIGKVAGLRTHMLVALGAALFTLVVMEAGGGVAELARLVPGIATGVGFLGAGTIFKLTEPATVKGLTTAASIWVTAAAGMAAGAGWLWAAAIGVALAWTVLTVMRRAEQMIDAHGEGGTRRTKAE